MGVQTMNIMRTRQAGLLVDAKNVVDQRTVLTGVAAMGYFSTSVTSKLPLIYASDGAKPKAACIAYLSHFPHHSQAVGEQYIICDTIPISRGEDRQL